VLTRSYSTWPSSDGSSKPTQAIALGLGSLFNHSTLRQNVGWQRLAFEQCIRYTALRDIAEGEELCISYGAPGVLWFEDADAAEVDQSERGPCLCEEHHGDLVASGLEGIEIDLS
jgi:uncharacterized protein